MAEPKVYPIYKGKRQSKLSSGVKDHYKGTLNPNAKAGRAASSYSRSSGS